MFTVEALTPLASVPATFQVTVCGVLDQTTAVFGDVTTERACSCCNGQGAIRRADATAARTVVAHIAAKVHRAVEAGYFSSFVEVLARIVASFGNVRMGL